MSPASKSKSKASSKTPKEQQKAASKLSSVPASVGNVPANAYNPISGTFHTLETAPPASSPAPQNNGRFRTIDENEEHCGSFGTAADYDSVSNNDSCSGESEDQKDKMTSGTTLRPENIPGCDTDKRDKVRQKNEKKHQRQKERRAQELHERCTGYLMSRKLEALSQQLVAMGFPAERATIALMLNEGRVEDSVSWLFEGGMDEEQPNATSQSNMANLKMDISDELAKIAEMELKFKCSKPEVERAVVACEGDLEKAAETLKVQKQEPPAAPPMIEESGDPPAVNGANKVVLSTQNPITRVQGKTIAPISIQQSRSDERDFNYSKVIAVGSAVPEFGNKNLQPRRIQSKTDWSNPQLAMQVEKRWPSASSGQSVSYSASPFQVAVPPTKADVRYALSSSEIQNLQAGTLREMALAMQRSQSGNTKQNLPSSSISSNMLPQATAGWNPNGASSVDMMKVANGNLGQNMPSLSQPLSNPSPSQPIYQPNHHQRFVSSSADNGPGALGWGNSWSNTGTSNGSSSSIAVTSSLGLFTGWGSAGASGSSSPVDWSTSGSMLQCDYNSIDWSMDLTPLSPNMWSSFKSDRNKYETWPTAFMGVKSAIPSMSRGVRFAGFQEGGFAMEPTPSGGQREWTSPFAGKDIFSLPRQFVTSPFM